MIEVTKAHLRSQSGLRTSTRRDDVTVLGPDACGLWSVGPNLNALDLSLLYGQRLYLEFGFGFAIIGLRVAYSAFEMFSGF